ncbi:CheA signal transduction histidine kinase [Anaeromyxobacter dehalogenans 2CP-1]|uniref:Chemotaxis protein CheA n=1 Tax=Anaeromyxobacter dehalogenans (strain ATCC BAA-258 / DSM 21875 / 2CP-1) TaxID=455488 RepID=B8JCV7_ANAD2|nr:chemotaxis protein CheA [Anaeromyxobacter dehalogenans]ACL63985.1 CheA signal transduction histidine kinase [Anaeromyxobacter dehalogenans 2CP-1]
MDELEIDREALLATFLAEADETFAHMEQQLLALERTPEDDELLNALFRDVHTLKGAASLVSFDGARDVAHDLEDVLERLRQKTLAVTDALVTLLLQSVDVLRRAVAEAEAGAGGGGASDAVLAFRARLAEAARAAVAERAAPSGAAEAPDAHEPHAPHAAAARTLRVDVGKLDRMLNLSGEIAIARGRLGEMLERRGGVSAEDALDAHREADRLYLDLQELIMKARMVPIGPTFHQHVRTLRDLASNLGKQARLVMEGEDVEVDTAVIEHIRDPLLHMVRNALDHGIERPDERRAAGKPPVGTLTLRAFHDAGSMVVQVLDDGRGLDVRRIAQQAVARGLASDPARIGPEDAAGLIFEPGLSTADAVTELSGRGVGMDVVRRNIEALRGSVSVESEPGHGTAITLRVPLTLAIIQGFKVGVGGETYILPLDAVSECLELPPEETRAGAPWGVINVRGKPLPYLRLRDHFKVAGAAPQRENVVVVQHGAQVAGVAVDVLHGESSTVIKPLGGLVGAVAGVSGSSILGNGRVALILDVAGILRETLRRAAAQAAA